MRKNRQIRVYTKVLHKKTDANGTQWFLAVSNPMTKDIIHLSIGQWDEDLCKNLRKLRIPEKQITDYFTHKNNRGTEGRCKTFNRVILVRVNAGISSSEGIGTLSHELLHAIHRLFEEWERKIVFDNKEEVMCCLMNFYLEQVINATSAAILHYTGTKLSWENTHYMEFNYGLQKKRVKNKK